MFDLLLPDSYPAIELAWYAALVAMVALLGWTKPTQPYIQPAEPATASNYACLDHATQVTSSDGPYRVYSRTAMWLQHTALAISVLLVTYSAITMPDPTWMHIASFLLHFTGLVLLILLDGVHIIGTAYQRKFLWIYSYLSVLGGIDYFQQPSLLLPLALFTNTLLILLLSVYVCFCNPHSLQANPPTAEAVANLWPFLSFGFLNSTLIKPGMKKPAMDFDDVPGLEDSDSAVVLFAKYEEIMRKHKGISLNNALFCVVWRMWLERGFFQILTSLSVFCAPLALEKILIYVKYAGDEQYLQEGLLPISIWVAVLIFFLGPATQSVVLGQSYIRGRRIGLRIRAMLVSILFKKSLTVDLGACKESAGKLNNLMSVDVGDVRECWAYSQFLWSAPLEIVLTVSLLLVVLGKAAIAGVITMVLFIVAGMALSSVMEAPQADLLVMKDKRMGIATEVLNSIRIIKYFSWEVKFMERVQEARVNELRALLKVKALGVCMYIIWQTVPAMVAMSAFLAYTQYLGETLTVATGFTAMTLFNALRYPLADMPVQMSQIIRARTSLKRISAFLETEDVVGLAILETAASFQSGQAVSQDSSVRLGGVKLENVSIAWREVQKDVKEEEKQSSRCSWLVDCCKTNQISGEYSPLTTIDVDDIESARLACPPSLSINTVLADVSLKITPGSLVVIIGSTGSGKSSLLQGLLGEALILQGARHLAGDISFSSQSAWIQNDTLRENILFGAEYEQERYEAVLNACALQSDLKLFPLGDLTEIGEKGVNLSGGQQQRVSLARAAYARSDIIILDDPLSAVDAHVGDHIFRELILGFLKGRTVLLVTHSLALALPHADQVLCVDAGQRNISHNASPRDLFMSLQAIYGQGEEVDGKATGSSSKDGSSSFMKSVFQLLRGAYDAPTERIDISTSIIPSIESVEEWFDHAAEHSGKVSVSCSLTNLAINHAAELLPQREHGKIIEIETKNSGEIALSTFTFYLRACGDPVASCLILLGCIWISVSWFVQSYCLSRWMESMTSGADQNEVFRRLRYYLLSVLSIISGYVVRAVYQNFSTLRASERLHASLVRAVMLAPCSWFDATPVGRIINRFSQDIAAIDMDAIIHLVDFADAILGTLQVLCVISYFLPQLLLPFIPIILYTLHVSNQYVHVSRELKRLESLMKTPVFVLFSETLNGLPVIRSFSNQCQRFFAQTLKHIDNMNRCHLYLWFTHRWLSFRMICMGALATGSVAATVVLVVTDHDDGHTPVLTSAAAGLALMYSLALCDNMAYCIWWYGDLQQDLNSVERVEEYASLPSERYGEMPEPMTSCQAMTQLFAPFVSPCCLRGSSSEDTGAAVGDIEMGSLKSSDPIWPTKGKVVFRNLTMRYKTSPAPVLRSISVEVAAGSKVGVVGRTGAGKSSLIAALYRLVEPESGELLIDDVDVLQMPLQQLRSGIAIVPQEPTLFRGTLRSNLDPFDEYADEVIWAALRAAQLDSYFLQQASPSFSSSPSSSHSQQQPVSLSSCTPSASTICGILDSTMVAEKGGNFSLGQRQLLCMARAILRRAKVLVLDECTASVDHDTDAMIQDTVRHGLHDSTVICIAHRLHTVAYYDRILVLDKGAVREYGCPYALLQDPHSTFHGLCQTSGAFQELFSIAKQAAQARAAN